MEKVVILGGGFAGVAAAKELLNKTKRSEVQISLVDRNYYHLFTPSLYEVASSEEPQKNICIPLGEILPRISIINDEALMINKDEKKVQLKNQTISFDYLIIALGSETEYHNIPGLKEHSIPLKTLDDATRIKNLIKQKMGGKPVQVLVGGGGATGCELTAELLHHLGKKVQISLVQKSPQLVKELNMGASKIAYKRLLGMDANICFGERIAKVYEGIAETDTGDTHKFDVFVWAGGVRGVAINNDKGLMISKDGRILVDKNLRVQGSENIFAAGDIASGYPRLAQIAKDQGKLAGENVSNLIKGDPLQRYKFKSSGFIVPLGGYFAVAQIGKFNIKGFPGWLIKQFIFLRYLLDILPPTKAFRKWNEFEEYLIRT